MTEQKYYVQNKDRGYLGNAPVWWSHNDCGYTAYINGARRFYEQDAMALVEKDPHKWAMYKCDDIDARLHLVFDGQDRADLGTDAPCGWGFGYAKIEGVNYD